MTPISSIKAFLAISIFTLLALWVSYVQAAQTGAASPLGKTQSIEAIKVAAVNGGASADAAESLATAVTTTITERFEINAGGYGFGVSVSLSGDRALIGDSSDNAAYMFVYNGTT